MRTYIWSLPTRIFHWSLVVFMIITWLSADDDFLQIHSAFGYAIAVLIIFRLLWGVFGPKFSRFSDFNFKLDKVLEFIRDLLSFKRKKKYLGHNPISSIIMFLMIISTFIITITGILALGIQEAKGYFAFLNQTFLKELELFEELHEFSANILLLFIFIHLSGVLTDRLIHKEDETLKSIITGYKNLEGHNIKLTIFQILIAFAFFILTILVIYFTLTNLTVLYS